MAIVKMKRLRVIAMAACREELLGQLQRLGCVEIREPETAGEDWSGLLERESCRLAEAKGALAEVNTALAAMRRYGQVKDGLFVKRRLVTEKEFLGGGLEAQAKTVTQDVGERLRTLSGIQTEMSRLQARRAGLLPWQDLDLPLEAEGTEHVLSRLGTCPAGTDVGALRLELEALPAELLEISADKQQRYLLLLCHRAAEEPVMEVLRAHGFSAAAFPGVTGTAAADLKQTDRQLEELQRRREEAEAAIAESSAKYGGYCYQIAFRILALREDAEECVGDTWLRAWEAMPPSRPGRLDTFLGKITRNLSLDRWRALRAQKRWQGQAELALTELGDCLPASGGVEQEVEAAALAESLNRFLESLPQEKRVLFVRRYWYLCSVEELAAWSGRRRGTVSAALFRLRQDLREHLEREGFTL